MTKFVVIYARIPFSDVTAPNAVVMADYFKVDEHGVLTFRERRGGGPNDFPKMVHTFAAGVWAEVTNAE